MNLNSVLVDQGSRDTAAKIGNFPGPGFLSPDQIAI